MMAGLSWVWILVWVLAWGVGCTVFWVSGVWCFSAGLCWCLWWAGMLVWW